MLIESFLPNVDLTHLLDTSGAYIPGHGTPTVILFGRHRAPVGSVVRTVMGVRGEPATPENPSRGHVWSAIVAQVDTAKSDSEWVSSEDVARQTFFVHPWSIGGGGVNVLMEHLDVRGAGVLRDMIREIGFGALTREDDVYLISREVVQRMGIELRFVKPMVAGEVIRDWTIDEPAGALWPYDESSLEPAGSDAALQFLWRYRVPLCQRVAYGQSQLERGLAWYEYSMFFKHRYRIPLSIAFAFVATHNQFVLDRGGKVFKQSAPLIKLPSGATEADHLALVGVLNSSAACFWMKQVFHNKGSTVDAHGARQTTDAFENFYEHTATGLKKFPLPETCPVDLAQALDRLATERQAHLPAQLADRFPIPPADLDSHREIAADLLARMIALQEELDWECYRLYGLIDEDCRYAGEAAPSSDGPSGRRPPVVGESAGQLGTAPCPHEHPGAPNTPVNPGGSVLQPERLRQPQPTIGDPTDATGAPAPSLANPSHGRATTTGESLHLRRGDEATSSSSPTPSRSLAGENRSSTDESPSARNAPRAADSSLDDDTPDTDRTARHREPPPLALGERAFEIVMARRMAAGALETTWFDRHGSTPITELPAHWLAGYRALVERRIALIESDRFIGLVERPEYKRRWNVEPWRDQERRALRDWLATRLESSDYWPEPRLATVRTLAARAATDADFQRVATRYTGHSGIDIEPLVARLVEAESVPALPVQRYKPSGLAKRAEWERTWALQRREDAIDAEVAAATRRRDTETANEHEARLRVEQRRRKREEIGPLAPPPKYRSPDFRKPDDWRLRGALDVPKERFVSLPQMSRDADPTLLVGWAGWTPLTLCHAVATYLLEVTEQEGWPPERLTPLLAVLHENLPWLKQWHNDIDPEYGQRLGDFYETFLHSQLSHLGLTVDDLRRWTPPKTVRRRRA